MGPGATGAARPTDAQRRLGSPKPVVPTQSPGEPAGGTGAVRTVLSLGAVLGLLGLGALAIKRLARSHGGLLGAAGPGGRAPAGVLEVLGRYPLQRGLTLMLLKLDRRVLLLSQSAAGRFGGANLTTLCEIEDPDEIASILVKVRDDEGESIARRFQTALGRADRAAGERPTESGRRTTVHPSGDRVELWSEPASAATVRGFAPAATEAGQAHGPSPETGADALRRRLGALRRLGGTDGGPEA